MPSRMLLKNSLVLTHSGDVENPEVIPLPQTDVLIEGANIAKIGKDLDVSSDTQVIDCTGKIVSPGFISTHSHLWQTQLKGQQSDHNLLDYMHTGDMLLNLYTPTDTYWGQLAGALEAVNAGTTTVLDHCHGCKTNEHIQSAVQATLDSGLRCVWAYAEPIRADVWTQQEYVPSQQLFDSSTMEVVVQAAKKHNRAANTGEGRLSVGLGHDMWFLPAQMMEPIIARLIEAGVRTITTHVGRDGVQGYGQPLTLMKNNAAYLFEERSSADTEAIKNIVLSHATNVPASELEVMFPPNSTDEHNKHTVRVSISTTPETESHVCMQRSVAFSTLVPHTVPEDKVSLGIDCHIFASSFMPHAARAGLMNARIRTNETLLQDNQKYPTRIIGTSGGSTFNTFTVNGAKALGLDHDDKTGIGRLAVGRKADIVILDAADSINMGAAVDFDPVIAVTRFSELNDVDTVIVDGIIRKRHGKLLPVDLNPVDSVPVAGLEQHHVRKDVGWSGIRTELAKSYRDLRDRVKNVSSQKAREALIQMWQIDMEKFV